MAAKKKAPEIEIKEQFVLRNTTPEGETRAYGLAILDTVSGKVIGVMSANLMEDTPNVLEIDAHSNATDYTVKALDEFANKYNRTVREELYILGLEWGIRNGADTLSTKGGDMHDQQMFFACANTGWFNMDGKIKVVPMSSGIPFEKK